jgi:hypothetical protein
MKYLALTIALLAFLFVSCDNSQTPTQAPQSGGNALDKTTQQWTNQSFDMWNPCCNEWVHFESKVHWLTVVTKDKDGNLTTTLRVNVANTKATGLSSGLKYSMQENDAIVNVNDPLDCPSSLTYDVKFRAVATGSGNGGNDCSFIYNCFCKWTRDADCNLTWEVLPGSTITCE